MTSRPGHLRLLLLGGFEAWHHDELLRGFESQKVRALLAYLVYHRGRAIRRDRLASLLWGDRDDDTARRNLRQAIYNLKATLPGESDAEPHLLVDPQELRFNRASDYSLDVEAFESAIGAGGVPAFRDLGAAAGLYRGDLLSGFLVRDCPEFEEWLVTEQERLRELALDALRRLVAGHLDRGEWRLGVRHARRLVAMDPLSEEAHRQLMRLYDFAGQRGRALAHYEDLRDLLRSELGVEPLEETRRLHESILADVLAAGQASEPLPAAPVVPLVGRREAYQRLAEEWTAVVAGDHRLTLVTGEEGAGKSRLARSFLDAATARRRAVVLTATACVRNPPTLGDPIAEALRQAVGDEELSDRVAALAAEERHALGDLLPDLAVGATFAESDPPGADRLAGGVAALLQRLTRREGAGEVDEPTVLLLDDLHLADPFTLEVVEALSPRLAGSRVWILAALDASAAGDEGPLARLLGRDGDGVVARVELGRLDAEAIEEVAAVLVEPAEVESLAGWLGPASGGLPLALVTLVNSMWDAGDLAPDDGGRWWLRGGADRWRERTEADLDELLRERVRRLPTSTRRLATLAAIAGPRFGRALLERAEDEHPAVVETGLELLVERWLVRQHRPRWHPSGLERSRELWARGARRGDFVFATARLRDAIYSHLNPLRRQALHRQVAEALAELHAGETEAVAEELAHHELAGGLWEAAIATLGTVERKARRAGDTAGAERAARLAGQARERLERGAAGPSEPTPFRGGSATPPHA